MYDATNTQGTQAEMVYTCPHCQGRFDFNAESALRQIFCPLCGKSFDPVKLETMRYPEGTPVSPSPIAGAETIPQPNKEERLPVGARLGQFRIDEFIGRGGMGAVYRATQTSLDRSVALKVLPRHMAEDPEFVTRFHREARALAELNHPNIVSIYDKGLDDGKYFFAMELVDGVSLRQLIKSKKATPAEALALVPQLCEALEYAHARGVIHRDIKPENILVDKSGRVKVADFGLARIIRGDNATSFDGLTRSDVMMGTVNYMAPEQRENAKDVDHRADIYSLGVVIYELLTGELPIGRFAPPSKKVQIDVRIDEMVMQLLEKDPDARYQRASDVRTHLARVMSEPAKPVVPVAPPSNLPWWIRSMPGGFLGLAGTVCVAAGLHALGSGGAALGSVGALFGFACLIASFWIDHGNPSVGERVPATALAGGGAFLVISVLGIFGFGVEATVAHDTLAPFWSLMHLWVYLATGVCAFVGFEGLSALVKVRPGGRWAGTFVNVVNLAVLLGGFAILVPMAESHWREELAFRLMIGYPIVAAVVFGIGWGLSRPVAAVARDAQPGVLTTLSMILGAALLAVGAGNAAYWCVRVAIGPPTGVVFTLRSTYDATAIWASLGYLFLLARLRTPRSGALQLWALLAGGILVGAGVILESGLADSLLPITDMAMTRLLMSAVLPCALAAAYAVFWVIARHADGPQAESSITSERPADSRSVRLFQAATGLWIIAALVTIAAHGVNMTALAWIFGPLGGAVITASMYSVSRIGRAEDDRVGTRYALGAIAASVVFPIAFIADPAFSASPARYMEVAFASGWIFVAFAVLDAALRPSRRLGRYFGLGGGRERKVWLGAIVGSALIGGMAIVYDYHGVNSGRDVLVGMMPFAGTIAYVFLVVWGVPLSKVMATGSECPVMDRGVQIQANCPSGAGVSITLGGSAPPVLSTPASSVPPVVATLAAATVPVAPPAPVVATVPAPGWQPPGVPEIPSPATPVASVSDKARRKGKKSLRKMWREAIWHAGVFLILKFALFGGLSDWHDWTAMWGAVVAAQLVMALFQTILDPPHRPAATLAAQKRRKEIIDLLQHVTWFAAISAGLSLAGWGPPWLIWMWGIAVAFHALSTVMDLGFGKEGA